MIKNIFLCLALVSVLFADNDLTYVGDKSCLSCHEKETMEWKNSDHDMAMQVATKNSVKADFNNTTFNYNGIITTFYKKDDKFMVRTDGPDGKLHDYEISYTFGIYPLQQYMIKFPNGKVQVLDPTWDSRSKEEGGQRWFHIHPDDNVTAGNVLHWTGPNMNWNYTCADCHSTNLKKNYDMKTKSYHTSWSSINVSCEACHGPASKHISWTKKQESTVPNKGFPVSSKKIDIETCAKCHSRRTQLDEDFIPGDKFNDHYLSVLLDDGLYFPDGKIDDEVYVYNSFRQSKMYAQGVTCKDCHDPHTLKRKAAGDKVCSQCHEEKKYMAPSHHKHKSGSKGSSCISCHMPARTYMGVDSRNDHSFRVPRPDISVDMKNIPNACNLCHTDKDASWATNAMKKWYGKIPVGKQNFAHEIQSLRTNSKNAPKSLYSILMGDAPNIAKITATTYLGDYPSKQTYTTIMQMLRKKNPAMRRAALQALESFPPNMRAKETFKMLSDPVKIVRIEASRQLSRFPLKDIDKETKKILENGFKEYEDTLLYSAERPEAQFSLGIYYANRNMLKKAEKAYIESLSLQPKFIPAYINYSNFLVGQNRDKEAFDLLKKGISIVPEMGILHHALGLWYVRNKNLNKALDELKNAFVLSPDDARFAYVYAIALAQKDVKQTIEILENAYKKHDRNLQIISALSYYYKQQGNIEKSKVYENILKELQKFSIK